MEFKTLDDSFFLLLNMTLASIAYDTSRADIENDLKKVTLLTPYGFKLQWCGTGPGTQMYVAAPIVDSAGTLSPANFVSIRGSVIDPFTEAFWVDWLDLNIGVFDQVDWPFSGDGVPSNAKIAAGSRDGLNELAAMSDSVSGQPLISYLNSIAPNMLFVNGHSLGGALATGWSLHLQKQTSQWVLPYTFAAPTIGDENFAQYMNGLFSGMYFARTYNTLDNIPQFWTVDGIQAVHDSYNPQPTCPGLIRGLLDAVKLVLKDFDYDYQHIHVGQGAALQGTLESGDSWFEEVGHQHSHLTYLQLLG